MRYIFAILVFCFAFSACQPEETPIFSDEKMINILIDVHLAEAALQGLLKEDKDSLTVLYYNQIYEIHEIEAADFYWQMEYLKQNPDYMAQIYEQVLDELTRREAELKKVE